MKPFTERVLCQDGRIRAVRGPGAAHGGLAEAGWGRQHHELAVDVRMGRHVGQGPPGPHGPEEEIVVYCSSEVCPRGWVALGLLRARGYRNVRYYRGGLADWEAAGYPLVGALASGIPAHQSGGV